MQNLHKNVLFTFQNLVRNWHYENKSGTRKKRSLSVRCLKCIKFVSFLFIKESKKSCAQNIKGYLSQPSSNKQIERVNMTLLTLNLISCLLFDFPLFHRKEWETVFVTFHYYFTFTRVWQEKIHFFILHINLTLTLWTVNSPLVHSNFKVTSKSKSSKGPKKCWKRTLKKKLKII